MTDTVIVFSADPQTGAYVAPVEVSDGEAYPELYSLVDPGLPADGHEWYLVDGVWVSQPIPTPPVPESPPVLPVTITEVNLSLVDGLYQGYTNEIIVVRGLIPYLPPSQMTIIVQEMVKSTQLIREHRFNAVIEATEDDVMRSFELRMRFDFSGNYVITQERLNEGLAEIGMPVRITMPKLDFNIVVAV